MAKPYIRLHYRAGYWAPWLVDIDGVAHGAGVECAAAIGFAWESWYRSGQELLARIRADKELLQRASVRVSGERND